MRILRYLFIAILFVGCQKLDPKQDLASATLEETAQQVGDTMSSIDETGGTSGAIASMDGEFRTFNRWRNGSGANHSLAFLTLPRARAASCLVSTFSACVNNVKTRLLDHCSLGAYEINGTVTLTWADALSDNTCQMSAITHSVTRVPNFTIAGGGSTYTVVAVQTGGAVGQKVTRLTSADSLLFTNEAGIRRSMTNSSGATVFDFTTQTVSGVTVTGAARSGRVLSGGSLRVTNNASRVYCDYVPFGVTWTSACNCATSGSWTSTCSDGRASNITITGCGTGTATMGSDSRSVTFDRCY